MARQIAVRYNNEETQFQFSKVDRTKLYGKRKRLVLDSEEMPCEKAELSDDGTTIVRSGMTVSAYFDEEGHWVAHGKLVGVLASGEAAAPVSSTLGAIQELEESNADELTLCQVQSVYLLDSDELAPGLGKALESGSIFRFPFAYRAGYSLDSAFLLANKEGIFCLVARKTEEQWFELAESPLDSFEEEVDLDDDLDFEMF